jgi:autotransporter-associated beta strand protein
LTKTGEGILQIAGATTFVGDTVLDGGTVAFNANNTLGNLVFGAAATVPSAPRLAHWT